MKAPSILYLIVLLGIGAAVLGIWGVASPRPSSESSVTVEGPELIKIPPRPESPELDYAGECVWLTNHVLRIPEKPDPPTEKQLEFLVRCAEGKGHWRDCEKYSEHVWGNSHKQRSEFFFKCLTEAPKNSTAGCEHSKNKLESTLRNYKRKLERSEYDCFRFCKQTPPRVQEPEGCEYLCDW